MCGNEEIYFETYSFKIHVITNLVKSLMVQFFSKNKKTLLIDSFHMILLSNFLKFIC